MCWLASINTSVISVVDNCLGIEIVAMPSVPNDVSKIDVSTAWA